MAARQAASGASCTGGPSGAAHAAAALEARTAAPTDPQADTKPESRSGDDASL